MTPRRSASGRFLAALILLATTRPAQSADLATIKTSLLQQHSAAVANQPKIAAAVATMNTNRLTLYRDMGAKSTIVKSLDQLGNVLATAKATEANLILAKRSAALRKRMYGRLIQ